MEESHRVSPHKLGECFVCDNIRSENISTAEEKQMSSCPEPSMQHWELFSTESDQPLALEIINCVLFGCVCASFAVIYPFLKISDFIQHNVESLHDLYRRHFILYKGEDAFSPYHKLGECVVCDKFRSKNISTAEEILETAEDDWEIVEHSETTDAESAEVDWNIKDPKISIHKPEESVVCDKFGSENIPIAGFSESASAKSSEVETAVDKTENVQAETLEV